MNAVAAGFAEPVLAAQSTFRVVMDAMARPGTIRRLAGITAPAPKSRPGANQGGRPPSAGKPPGTDWKVDTNL